MRASTFRVCRCCLPLCLLVLAAGCNQRAQSIKYVPVSGKVLYKGKALPGGRITFVTVKGSFASSANIREDGTYKMDVPIGDVLIGVDNTMLGKQRGAPTQMPQSEGMMKHSSGELDPIKGHYVNLPTKYRDPETSGLTYKVENGEQTHDVTLE
jgi:hypothetical protein